MSLRCGGKFFYSEYWLLRKFLIIQSVENSVFFFFVKIFQCGIVQLLEKTLIYLVERAKPALWGVWKHTEWNQVIVYIWEKESVTLRKSQTCLYKYIKPTLIVCC